nr:uncharacterized protein LOC105499876 isoform X2 [Macaca nemestrina]
MAADLGLLIHRTSRSWGQVGPPPLLSWWGGSSPGASAATLPGTGPGISAACTLGAWEDPLSLQDWGYLLPLPGLSSCPSPASISAWDCRQDLAPLAVTDIVTFWGLIWDLQKGTLGIFWEERGTKGCIFPLFPGG